MKAVLDDRHVDVQDIPRLQQPIARHAVTDLVVHRGADRLRKRAVARRRIVERRRHGVLHVDHVSVAKVVQLPGGDAGTHVRRDEIEHLGGEATGDAHPLDLLGGLQHNSH